MELLEFPEDFIWGVATSAQQIEGGFREGGRGESIWDRFAGQPGRIADGSNAEIACDHYNLWREDIELMKWLGVGAYRFSISWPRVLPEGRGAVNEAGLDFYDALVDALLAAGISPFITLYHWDLPQKLQDEGGWERRETAEAFVEYAAAAAERLGDRVTYWTTHNEPWVIANMGHLTGEHAPGHRDPGEALRVSHHLLLSHGWAVKVLRAAARDIKAGIVVNIVPARPTTESPADRKAARRFDGLFTRWYLDPIFRGGYPPGAVEDRIRLGHLKSPRMDFTAEGDLDAISTSIDFLGINYYSPATVKAGPDEEPVVVRTASGDSLTDMGWEVCPEALHDVLARVDADYHPKEIFITENGAAFPDSLDESGRVRDQRRVDYLEGHLKAARRAAADGVPLRGYFAWSLMDNFEWAHGYTKRFGLFWVDFSTLKRYPKDSAYYFRNVIAANAVGGGLKTGQ